MGRRGLLRIDRTSWNHRGRLSFGTSLVGTMFSDNIRVFGVYGDIPAIVGNAVEMQEGPELLR